MAIIVIDRKQFLKYISSFGKGVEDLKITFKNEPTGKMVCTVAYISHYLKKVEVVDGKVTKEGDIDIAELTKVKQIIKAFGTDNITLNQSAPSKPLHITAGTSKISIPSSATIVSYSKVPLFEKLINKAIKDNWTKFHESELPVSGEIFLDDLTVVSKMRGILNNTAIFTVTAHVGEGEFAITSGQRHEAKLLLALL